MLKTTLTAITLIGVVLAGCAGRVPTPVSVVQPTDAFADCTALIIEAQTNNQKLQELAGDQGAKTAQNVAAGVVGLVIWPLWFAMDFQGTAGVEMQALQARQQYLASLAEQRRCGEDTGAPPKVITEKKPKSKPKAEQ